MPSSESPVTERSLAELVRNDSRCAAVFERFGLDFCCHGFRSLDEAASDRGVPVGEVLNAIEQLGKPLPEDCESAQWTELDALTRHIVDRHHEYVRRSGPIIETWLNKLVDRHGAKHPELRDVQQAFVALHAELLSHMIKEEHLLFPFIDEMAEADRVRSRPGAGFFGTIRHPIRVMEDDHERAGELIERLHQLTHGYEVPPDGCATFNACYTELERFARDLRRHIHLENNILFPAASELEARLA